MLRHVFCFVISVALAILILVSMVSDRWLQKIEQHIVPSAVPLPSVIVRPMFVQNHIYQNELAQSNTSCEECRMDEELGRFGWDPSRYPWRIVSTGVVTNSSGAVHPEVLLGTALAQKVIWAHQHPKNCSNATFMQYYHLGGGMGSQLHLLGQALALAMHLGRVLVLPSADPEMRLIDPTFCPGAHGFECWLQNITHCHPTGDVISIFKVPGVPGFSHQSVPEVFRPFLASSPIKRTFWFYWWRAQSVTYLVRFNKRTREALDSLRSETLFACDSPARMPVLEAGTISVHVRHGRKWSEASMYNFTEYKNMLDHLADDSQDLRVLYEEVAESNATFSYPAEAYSGRKAFISTEDPTVVDEALKLCSAAPRWQVFYTKVNRSNDDPWTRIGSFEHARREILIGFMNLELALEADAWVCTLSSNWCRLIDELRMTIGRKAELALEADAWVCTLSSNWCRLIDELRMTIGRKASHPYLSLSKGMKEPCRPAEPHCYLSV
eukprot:s5134_g5.t1